MTDDLRPISSPAAEPSLVQALAEAYAGILKRQRTASSAFVRWSSGHRRAPEFAWLPAGRESILMTGKPVVVDGRNPIFELVKRMHDTIELNPYERELQYGFPYVIGHRGSSGGRAGVPIRAPLLTIPIRVVPDGDALRVEASDDVLRFNSLPFRSDFDSAAHERSLATLIEATPVFPLGHADLRAFCDAVVRELSQTGVELRARLDGVIEPEPARPSGGEWLAVQDLAACFVAPKTSYFLTDDLETIGQDGGDHVDETALQPLLGLAPNRAQSDLFDDERAVFFPFSSNPSQRRVARLLDEADNQLVVMQGPPGTGKSLTIANLACHLVATGRRVLISSQKDQALRVVDDLLGELEMEQLPMTLLRSDRESKGELRERLNAVRKDRAAAETQLELDHHTARHAELAGAMEAARKQFSGSLSWEDMIAWADGELGSAACFFARLKAKRHFKRTLKQAQREASKTSDVIAAEVRRLRADLRDEAVDLLDVAAEHRVGSAGRQERNHLREFAKLLGRSERNAKNFSIFDRLKSEPDRCEMLLSILPCWIMTPDDVARLFPCQPGLFDVVIIDEASQCDLPSMTPVLYRAKKAVVAGDSKQMQAQRLRFTSGQVALEAWHQSGLGELDPDGWLDPRNDLLRVASIRADEEPMLEEHYRSLPPIINFSNNRWYGGKLRIMRDAQDVRFGDPDRPTITLHHVENGRVTVDTQENEAEARALLDALKEQLDDPAYASASFGVLCLFEDQMRLVAELVADEIDEETRLEHELVVVNPDGFQGDERDVIYYSLSYDADVMPQSALSARQMDTEHVQGMLNVAFTRARDETHVFHSAGVSSFGMASGQGALRDWLEHCDAAEPPSAANTVDLTTTDSEFEAEVIQALVARGVGVTPQYPSCGYRLDILAGVDGRRLVIECDGEPFHTDEHGDLRIEDVQRQEVLERAGWQVERIPYRRWRASPQAEIERIMRAFVEPPEDVEPEQSPGDSAGGAGLSVGGYEAAIVQALQDGHNDRGPLYRAARQYLGFKRLGSNIEWSLDQAVVSLERRGIVHQEDGEIFLGQGGRGATVSVPNLRVQRSAGTGYRRPAHRRRRRRRY